MGQWVASLDMYRKVPTDLLEGTKRGSILSYGAIILMVTLIMLETRAYFSNNSWVSSLALDDNQESRLQVNFNITMMDLRCEWAVVDTVSVLGTDQNITAHISKWNLDGGGIRKSYHGRNKNQKDIALFDKDVTETYEQLLEDGEQAVSLDYHTFKYALDDFEYLFVDFFASWCSHCLDLAPTWETLAEVMEETVAELVEGQVDEADWEEITRKEYEHTKAAEKPVMIAKVDCVLHHALCQENLIMAYPTLRLYVDGEHVDDYRGHRTVIEMADWLVQKEGKHEKDLEASDSIVTFAAQAARRRMEIEGDEAKWLNEIKHKYRRGQNNRNDNWDESEHPGCRIKGSLMIDRVPGNFHIQARSNQHDLVPHMTNVSHIVHELSIGDPLTRRMITGGKVMINCVLQPALCQESLIMAYPTLRLYVDGEHADDYRGHRTVIEMADWLVQKEGKHEKETETSDSAATIAAQAARRRMEVEGDEAEWFNEIKHKHHRGKHNRNDNWDESEHPGCQIVGSLMIDRVPGNFHIQARSNQHDLVPHMTNVSHIVHELSIGDPLTRRMITGGKVEIPEAVKDKFSPMDSNSYVTHEYHQAYHHYLKVVTTDIEGLKSYKGRQLKAYQIIYSSQRALYGYDKIPEAKFIYDLAPIAVNYKKEQRQWYDYLTSLMAIIGGTFTLVGMTESGINAALAKRRRR
eukprot:CAMPEP_0194159148 /NCGR_PEP_ID=MMETSP0152-20130528/77668_1 /TAXON_ID=1049557 /ORGANISM="Thalassiothrix antarctica, Strain L6-D1" /LENGTH=690 /DNA_ID=CAMNT_0038868679 /DNA_START=81 /DNA_END=2153 /DNA_ORIENTATION=+